MTRRVLYMYIKLRDYLRAFGIRGPFLMLRLYVLMFLGKRDPVFVRLAGGQDGIWIRPALDLGIFHQVFVHDEYGLDFGPPPTTIVDAGANIGCAAVYFSRRFPQARILCIEPTPSTFAMLNRNTAERENIKSIQAALWCETTDIEIVDESAHHLAVQVQESSGEDSRIRVEGITVAEAARRAGFGTIGILKLDIEGAEEDVFRNSDEWLQSVNCIAIEFHEWLRPGSEQGIRAAIDAKWSADSVVRGENVVFRKVV